MRKTIFVAILMIFSMGATTAFADNSKSNAPAIENKLSAEEISRLTKRVEEIRMMDKSKMTTSEKLELKKEVLEIKQTVKESGGVVYISGAALILIIILILLLL